MSMTEPTDHFRPHPALHNGVSARLEALGFSKDTIEALLRFDVTNFHWRRMYEKGELKGKVLQGVENPLEPAMAHGLIALARISIGLGLSGPEEPTIGRVAELMEVDPSRASRIVSELVSRGFAKREPSQQDARKTIISLTPKGSKYLGDFTASKWRLMVQIFEGWEEDEIKQFSALFQKYVLGLARVSGASGFGSDE